MLINFSKRPPKILLGLLVVVLNLVSCHVPPTPTPTSSDIIFVTLTPTATLELFPPQCYGQVNVSEAIIREEANEASPEIVRLSSGAIVIVLARQGDWVQIMISDTSADSGWILAELLNITQSRPTSTITLTPPPTSTPVPPSTPIPTALPTPIFTSTPTLLPPPPTLTLMPTVVPPIIRDISPTSGFNYRGVVISVTGQNFRPNESGFHVELIGPSARVVLPVTGGAATSFTAIVPPGLKPGQYDLLITNPDGRVGIRPRAYEVVALPTATPTFLPPPKPTPTPTLLLPPTPTLTPPPPPSPTSTPPPTPTFLPPPTPTPLPTPPPAPTSIPTSTPPPTATPTFLPPPKPTPTPGPSPSPPHG